MTDVYLITGYAAIEYAEANGLLLCKHSDPTEDHRAGITPDEAYEIASEDPSLIYLDPTESHPMNCYATASARRG
jgi:hypothetical protein